MELLRRVMGLETRHGAPETDGAWLVLDHLGFKYHTEGRRHGQTAWADYGAEVALDPVQESGAGKARASAVSLIHIMCVTSPSSASASSTTYVLAPP